jgi:hypothetical protein
MWAYFPGIRCSTFSISGELNQCLKRVCDSLRGVLHFLMCFRFLVGVFRFLIGTFHFLLYRPLCIRREWDVRFLQVSYLWIIRCFIAILYSLSTYLLNQSNCYSGWNNWEAQLVFFFWVKFKLRGNLPKVSVEWLSHNFSFWKARVLILTRTPVLTVVLEVFPEFLQCLKLGLVHLLHPLQLIIHHPVVRRC